MKYSEISDIVYEYIDQYKADGLSDEEITAKTNREMNMSTDLLRFLLKNKK